MIVNLLEHTASVHTFEAAFGCCQLWSKHCHDLKVHWYVALLRVSVHQRGQGMSVLIWSTPAKDVGPTALLLAHL